MGYRIAIVYYSLYGRLVTLANVIAEGARKVRFSTGMHALCTANLQIAHREPKHFPANQIPAEQ